MEVQIVKKACKGILNKQPLELNLEVLFISSLVIGHWSLVIGYWLLVIGHWSLGNRQEVGEKN